MILKFIKECPTRHNKKNYKEGSEVIFSDYKYGEKLIDEGFAIRVDKHEPKEEKKIEKKIEFKKENK